MRNRYNRRNRMTEERDQGAGMLAQDYTILGTGDPALYTDLNISIDAGGAVLPPVPVLPPGSETVPTEGPTSMPAFQQYRPVPFWIAVNTPAAGADFTYQHDYDFPARLLLCYLRLVTSAVVGSRTMILTLRDTANARKAAIFPNVSQAASITRDWQFCHNWPLAAGTHSYTGTLGLIIGWMPQVTILPNEFFGTELALNVLDAGDQLSNIKLLMIKEPNF
jgi:hypothetical protein